MRGAAIVVNQNGVAYPAWAGLRTDEINEPLREALNAADYVFFQSEFCKSSADRFLGRRDDRLRRGRTPSWSPASGRGRAHLDRSDRWRCVGRRHLEGRSLDEGGLLLRRRLVRRGRPYGRVGVEIGVEGAWAGKLPFGWGFASLMLSGLPRCTEGSVSSRSVPCQAPRAKRSW